jgi:hypothetical protein
MKFVYKCIEMTTYYIDLSKPGLWNCDNSIKSKLKKINYNIQFLINLMLKDEIENKNIQLKKKLELTKINLSNLRLILLKFDNKKCFF